jgi:hypothetical protein
MIGDGGETIRRSSALGRSKFTNRSTDDESPPIDCFAETRAKDLVNFDDRIDDRPRQRIVDALAALPPIPCYLPDPQALRRRKFSKRKERELAPMILPLSRVAGEEMFGASLGVNVHASFAGAGDEMLVLLRRGVL